MAGIIRGYKVRLEPNNKQTTVLFKFVYNSRYVWNWLVALNIKHYEEHKIYVTDEKVLRTELEVHKEYKEWLQRSSVESLRMIVKDYLAALWKFIKVWNGEGYKPYTKKQIEKAHRTGKELTRYDMQKHPKFKKKGMSELSFYRRYDRIKFENGKVFLECISTSKKRNRQALNWVRLSEKNRIPEGAKYSDPRIKFDGFNWYISVGVAETVEPVELIEETVGIDLNIGSLAHCSDGTIVPSINKDKRILKAEKSKKRMQKSVSRSYRMNNAEGEWNKTVNIKRKEKAVLKKTRYVTNIRNDFLHKESTKIVARKPRVIVMEDLNIQGMMKNRHLSKAIQKMKWYLFRTMVKNKSCKQGTLFMLANRYYPSSKRCNCCGAAKKFMHLSERKYICESCGYVEDRDFNSSYNLRDYPEIM